MTETHSHIRPPTEASPARRALHTLIALAGWALFAYWWTVVFARVSHSEIRFTVIFVLVSLVASIAITGLWVLHNVSIFRRKGPRTGVREVTLDYTHDPLGRPVTFDSTPQALLSAPAVRVRIDAGGKSFRPAARPNGPSAAAR
jgi:hypothetical protein